MIRGTRAKPGASRQGTVVKRAVVIVLLAILGPIAAYIVFVVASAAVLNTLVSAIEGRARRRR